MMLLRKLLQNSLVLIFCILSENLNAQPKLENEIISNLIKNQFKAHDPDTIYSRKGKIKKIKYFKIQNIVLVKETQTNTRIRSNDSIIIEYLKTDLRGFDPELYKDFKQKNLYPITIDSIKDYKATIYYTSKSEVNEILDGGRGWMSFGKEYHYSPLVEVSRPGLNKKHNKALIYFSRSYGPLSGSGAFLLLELENNKWIEKGWSLVWIS